MQYLFQHQVAELIDDGEEGALIAVENFMKKFNNTLQGSFGFHSISVIHLEFDNFPALANF